MTALATPPGAAAPAGRPGLRQRPRRARRRRGTDRMATAVLTVAMAVACLPLVLILYVVVREGIGVVGVEFFTSDQIRYQAEGGGFQHGFFGTFFVMALAIPMAVGLGIAAAVYLVEYGRGRRLATAVRFVTDVMTGVPSIFVGLVVYAVVVRGTSGLGWGFGTFVGAVAIALIMLPIVVRAGEEMLKLVPDSVRNASYGLGARKWQTVIRVVLPAAAPGLATGSMLAVARGAGETAPLILTLLGSVFLVTTLQGQPQSALPLLILEHANQPFAPGIARAWGGALCLVLLTLGFTIVARTLAGRFASRREGM
jgi:phosphate transport system permease protein